MLRVTILDHGPTATFKLEGKLTEECVSEARNAWEEFTKTLRRRPMVVDLSGVTFIDERGQEMLARMHSAGAKLIATGPMMRAWIEEIVGGDTKGPSSGWIRSVWSLLFVLLLACQMHRTTGDARILQLRDPAKIAFPSETCIVAVNSLVRFSSIPGSSCPSTTLAEGVLA